MKKHHKISIVIILCLLFSFSTLARTPNLYYSSPFQADLKEELIFSKDREFNLNLSSKLNNWLRELTKRGQLVIGASSARGGSERASGDDGGRLVKGITFYDNRKDANKQVDFFTEEKVIVNKDSGRRLAVLPGGLTTEDSETFKKKNSEVEIDYTSKQQLNLEDKYFLTEMESQNTVDNEARWLNSKLNLEDNLKQIEELNGIQSLPDNIQKVGINYRPSEETTIFADYLEQKSDSVVEDKLTTTVVGLEYNNDSGKITMQYQVDDFEEKESSSARIELGFNEFARLRAIYTRVNKDANFAGQQSGGERQLDKGIDSKSLDLGLDLYVTEDASLKLGYQLADEDKAKVGSDKSNLLDKISPDAADIKLEIKF